MKKITFICAIVVAGLISGNAIAAGEAKIIEMPVEGEVVTIPDDAEAKIIRFCSDWADKWHTLKDHKPNKAWNKTFRVCIDSFESQERLQ